MNDWLVWLLIFILSIDNFKSLIVFTDIFLFFSSLALETPFDSMIHTRPSADQRTVAKAISVWRTAWIYFKGGCQQESDKRGVMTAIRNGRDTENLKFA